MKQKSAYTVAVVGATGAVGAEMIEILEERKFPVDVLRPLASYRSAGGRGTFHDQGFVGRELAKDSFQGVDIALFPAGAANKQQSAPLAAQRRRGGGRKTPPWALGRGRRVAET